MWDRIVKPKGYHKGIPTPPPSNEERIRKFNSENPRYIQPYNENVEYYLNELSGVVLNVITEQSWHVGEETMKGLQEVVELGKFLQSNELIEITFAGKVKKKIKVKWKPFIDAFRKYYDEKYPKYAKFVLPSSKGAGQPKGPLLNILTKGYTIILSLHLCGITNHFLAEFLNTNLETFNRNLQRAKDSIFSKK